MVYCRLVANLSSINLVADLQLHDDWLGSLGCVVDVNDLDMMCGYL
jgi:hypothetical protein